MIPLEPPKDASVVKEGDFWIAVVANDRFERFRSENDAWGWVLCLCSEDDTDDVGEVGDLDSEIAEHQRVLRIMKARLLQPRCDSTNVRVMIGPSGGAGRGAILRQGGLRFGRTGRGDYLHSNFGSFATLAASVAFTGRSVCVSLRIRPGRSRRRQGAD